MTEDFLGSTARDLYQKVFEIEDVDRLYLEYSAKASLSSADENERERLAKQVDLSADDKAKLLQLERESRLINRAAGARQERLKSEDLVHPASYSSGPVIFLTGGREKTESRYSPSRGRDISCLIPPAQNPHERSLAHAALISDDWRRSVARDRDGARVEKEATAWQSRSCVPTSPHAFDCGGTERATTC
jgi:hypothetical protein